MMNSNLFEDELDAIRIRLYEQTKDMTTEEHILYINSRAREILNTHGIKPVYMNTVRNVQ